MLMASVLAVVAGSPAQAANTSGEYLVDHDNDASTAMVREFGGRDRYDTALKLATRFANDRGGIGSVPNAFLASGESLVDAVSVAGLAGFMDAPVLLTPSSNLHRGVADFIEDYGVSNIYVVGGTAAIADGVVDALEALAGVGSVDRIAGDTRYDTSAAIASNLAGESWCGTNENSAIIVNGADESLFDAVAIGPVANRLELPVLLTAGDELVDSVLSYIETEDVEHAVIVGGTGSVSDGVEQALSDAGVDTVERIGGDSAAATSVAIAEVIGDDCADDLSPVSVDTVALVNRSSLADGISAGPVLADDADQLGNGLIPILAVGDTLPASVRDYLAATPEERSNGDKLHLRVLAIGGTAAVSDSVVSAATDAAGSADALTVNIYGANADGTLKKDLDGNPLPLADDDTAIVLKFSDDILREFDAAGDRTETLTGLRNRLEDILFINGVPADIASQTDDAETTICQPDTVTVNLEPGSALSAGDTVSIVESTIRVGADEDRRTVQAAEVTVPSPPADTQRPSVRIIAIIGHDVVYALVTDNAGLDLAEPNTLMAALASNGSLTDANGDDLIETITGDANITAVTTISTTLNATGTRTVGATLQFTLANDPDTASVTEAIVDRGDRFRINRGAIEDLAGNESQVTTAGAVAAVSKLQVSSVLMSSLNHTANAVTLIPAMHEDATAPTEAQYRGTNPNLASPQAAENPSMWLQAKGDGAAAGVYGNGWSVRADRASNWDGDKDVDVQVFVSTKDRRIVIRVANGKPKFADVKAALEANATVNGLFNVLVDNEYDGDVDTCAAANPEIQHGDLPYAGDDEATADEGDDTNTLIGGVTKARLVVNFNGWVEAWSAAENTNLLNAVFDGSAQRYVKAVDAVATTAQALTLIYADLGTDAAGDAEALAGAEKVNTTGPVRTATISITARGLDGALQLPAPRDIVDVPDGFDKILTGEDRGDPIDSAPTTDVVDRQDTDQSPDGPGVTAVANGYGDTAAGENDHNYGSKTRVTRSSSVAAPR